jgi:hypothetical protein
MNKVKEIVTAWITSFNPTDEEKKLAEDRYEICISCDQRGNNLLGIEVCNSCGCPLSKKIFTQKQQDSCPLKKWDGVDTEFRNNKLKNNKYKIM